MFPELYTVVAVNGTQSPAEPFPCHQQSDQEESSKFWANVYATMFHYLGLGM